MARYNFKTSMREVHKQEGRQVLDLGVLSPTEWNNRITLRQINESKCKWVPKNTGADQNDNMSIRELMKKWVLLGMLNSGKTELRKRKRGKRQRVRKRRPEAGERKRKRRCLKSARTEFIFYVCLCVATCSSKQDTSYDGQS